jgi:hypothetical protein
MRIFLALGASVLMAGAALGSTCPVSPAATQDYISISAVATTCGSADGNPSFTPLSGYVLLVSNTFNVSDHVTSGNFSLPSGYSNLELFFQSGTGLPHPDQFVLTLPFTSSIAWTLLDNVYTNPGNVTFTDYILSARAYGLPDPAATPLPSALVLFGSGLAVVFGLIKRQARRLSGAGLA